jgi:hypothetical protein
MICISREFSTLSNGGEDFEMHPKPTIKEIVGERE